MKVLAVCLLALFSIVLAEDARQMFRDFQRKYSKVYATESEFNLRFNNFQSSLARAARTQRLNPNARFGVTKFSDLSADEFAQFYLMPNYTSPKVKAPAKTVFEQKAGGPDPNNFDWGSQGVITPVYNQGQCGSCWAFSATETIESYWALAGNSLTELSMEQIVDCDTVDQGCNGGNTNTAYEYVEGAGGIDSEASYPYTAGGGNSGSCNFQQGSVVCTVTGYSSIDGEQGLYQQLSTAGPVSVCVDASSWQDYQGGVLTSCTNNIDHCVQATGYYQYSAGWPNAYWNVRNSWGTDWGQSGYIWVAIGQDLCAIGDDATIVTTGSGRR